jgi:hypothetical protein
MTQHDSSTTSVQDTGELVKSLCDLLQEQVTCVREGNLSRVEQLGEQVDRIIARMRPAEGHESPVPVAYHDRLRQLYEELTLAIQAQMHDVGARLKLLRRVKRAAGAYQRGRHHA